MKLRGLTPSKKCLKDLQTMKNMKDIKFLQKFEVFMKHKAKIIERSF